MMLEAHYISWLRSPASCKFGCSRCCNELYPIRSILGEGGGEHQCTQEGIWHSREGKVQFTFPAIGSNSFHNLCFCIPEFLRKTSIHVNNHVCGGCEYVLPCA